MRVISPTFIEALKNGVLKPFLDNVKIDDALCLEIRKDYINIYYRGGNLFKITELKKSSPKNRYRIHFDTNYLKYCESIETRKRIESISPFDTGVWIDNTQTIKAEMDRFLSKHPKLEREFQQLVERENNASSIAAGSDYFVADIEYANQSIGCRFDMLGVKWLSQGKGIDRQDPSRATLSIIEVKYGDKALKGSAGIKKHVEDVLAFIKNDEYRRQITDEATSLFNQKYELGLMGKNNAPSPINIKQGSPIELILLIGNHNPHALVLIKVLLDVNSSKEYQELRKHGCEIKIAKASLLGYGLYDHKDCMIALEEYLERYSA
jgi:hypothetical protein